MAKYILSIDQGTTGTTAALVSSSGKIIAHENVEFKQIYPKPGWVEHQPNDIWKSVLTSLRRLKKKQGSKFKDICAIGITNQRETSILWDGKTGEPVSNAIVWQCRRTTGLCNSLKKKGYEKKVYKKTGLFLDPYFSATKFSWLLRNSGRRSHKDLKLGTVDSFLVWKLTGGAFHATDVTNASRTSLLNLKSLTWDDDLLKLFKVPKSLLPEVLSSNDYFGATKKVPGLKDGIPIFGALGDQQSALFGQTAFKKGEAKCTFGTGSFLLMNTGEDLVRSKNGLLTTVAWKLAGASKATYALEGGAFICGAAVQWLRDGLGIIKNSGEVEALAKKVKDSGGAQFVPAFAGLGAPHWKPEARGVITGLTRGVTKEHLAYATLESMALQNVELLNAMKKDLGASMKTLRVDGGAVNNEFLLQMQADYLGTKVIRPKSIETTVLGAAYMAGLGLGLWSNYSELTPCNPAQKVFKPKTSSKQRNERLVRWSQAVEKTS